MQIVHKKVRLEQKSIEKQQRSAVNEHTNSGFIDFWSRY